MPLFSPLPGAAGATAYRPEIDGLRALAILPVILFHAGMPGLGGGFLGVDIFLVISGYLITRQLLEGLAAGQFRPLEFYERRARRILPMLLLVTAVSLLPAWWLMTPPQLAALGRSVVATLFFSSNILFWRETGYFAPGADRAPLLHTWSLGVEEQFYLVFPLLLLALWRWGARAALGGCAALALLSLAYSEWGPLTRHARFYLLPSRWWELLAGALLALQLFRAGPTAAPPAAWRAWLGLVLILGSLGFFSEETRSPGLWTVLPVSGAWLVLRHARADNLPGRLLASRPLVAVGLVSYSAYLWHHLLFAYARIASRDEPGPGVYAGLILLTFLLAALSWRWVERPCRDRRRVPSRLFRRSLLMAVAVLTTVGLLLHLGQGLPGRLTPAEADWHQALQWAQRPSPDEDGPCRFRVEAVSDGLESRFQRCAARYGQAVVIQGDSHAEDLFNALLRNSRYPFIVAITRHHCSACLNTEVRQWVTRRQRQVRVVLFTQRGALLLRQRQGGAWDPEAVERTRRHLRALAVAAPVYWLGPQAEPGVDLRNFNYRRFDLTPDDARYENPALAGLDAHLAAISRGQPYHYLSKLQGIGYGYARDFRVNGRFTHADGHHWSPEGEQLFGARLLASPELSRWVPPD